MPVWSKNPVIFEINTFVWLDYLKQKYETPITLNNVPYAEWDEIKRNGFDAVWLMGIWQRSPEGVVISSVNESLTKTFKEALPDYNNRDNIGSAYCVRNYVVDERLGGNAGLAVARAEMAKRGLFLILDYVPNHVSRDHIWVRKHPEYFIQGKIEDLLGSSGDYFESNRKIIACGRDPYFPAWQDVAQLNVFHPDVRIASARILSMIAGMCDGVRCDMAMLLLNHVFAQTWSEKAGHRPENEYWHEVIDAVHQDQPDFLFIAEAYWDLEWQLIQCGFDYCYDKRLYDRLVNGDAAQIRAHLTADLNYQNHMVRFIENHDEERAAKTMDIRKMMLAAITASTVPGAKLFHEGQLEGRKVHTPVFLRRRVEEEIYTDYYRFYQQLIRTSSSTLVKEGAWQLCPITGWENHFSQENLMAWSISTEQNVLLVVINYSETRSQGLVHLPLASLAGITWRLVDIFKGDVYVRNGDDMIGPGLFVDLSPWDFHYLWFARKME
jgi:glycosidase